MKSHYTYRLIALNPIDERVEYIGVRSCDGAPEDDTAYMSSSREIKKLIRDGLMFRKDIIAVHKTRKSAVAHEVALHVEFDVARNTHFFNKAKQTSVGWDTSGVKLSKETVHKMTARMQKQWSDPSFKEKQIEKLKKRYEDENVRIRQIEILNEIKNRPDVKIKKKIKQQERWACPKTKASIIENIKKSLSSSEARDRKSVASKLVHARPGFIERKNAAIKKANERQDVKERRSTSMKQAWTDIETRSRIMKAHKEVVSSAEVKSRMSAAQKINQNKHEMKEMRRTSTLASWENPEIRKRRSDGIKKKVRQVWALRKQYCKIHGITNPGSNYCNINKNKFKQWVAAKKSA